MGATPFAPPWEGEYEEINRVLNPEEDHGR